MDIKYRLLMQERGKWLSGLNEYSKEECEARARFFRAKGKKVKVVPNSYFGL